MRHAVLLASFLVSVLAQAQTIYTWTDSRGTVHYTDDPSTVPANVKATTTTGDDLSHMGTPPPAQPAPVAQAPAPTPPGANAPNPKSDEEYWRGQFRAAHDKIRQLEDELAIDEGRFYDSSRTPMGPNYACAPGYYAPGFVAGPGYPQGYGRSQVTQGRIGGSLNVPLPGGASFSANANVGAGSTVTRGGTTGAVTGSVAPFAGYGGYGGYGYGYGPCIYQPYGDYAVTRERIERTRAELARAKEDLSDLERRAANASVPLEWRR